MGCSKCKYAPICPDAYTEKSHLCGNYGKKERKEACKAGRKE